MACTSVAEPPDLPLSCSGAIQVRDPTRSPRCMAMAGDLATPKSSRRTPCGLSTTLDGFRSRCTTPAEWMAATARTRPMAKARNSSSGSGPARPTRSPNVMPCTYSMTTQGGVA